MPVCLWMECTRKLLSGAEILKHWPSKLWSTLNVPIQSYSFGNPTIRYPNQMKRQATSSAEDVCLHGIIWLTCWTGRQWSSSWCFYCDGMLVGVPQSPSTCPGKDHLGWGVVEEVPLLSDVNPSLSNRLSISTRSRRPPFVTWANKMTCSNFSNVLLMPRWPPTRESCASWRRVALCPIVKHSWDSTLV